VVTATALHWLTPADLRRLYGDLWSVVRVGGVVANCDTMPPGALPRLATALDDLAVGRRAEVMADGRPDWESWWDEAADDPALAEAVAERHERFGGPTHPVNFAPPASWHIAALAAAGFAEAGVAWRSANGAVVAAVR
jgi:hypothetical protein